MRIIIEMPDGQGGLVTRTVEVPDPGTQGNQGMQAAGSTAYDAGAGAWDAGSAPALNQLLAGLPKGTAGQPGQVAPPIMVQSPEEFHAAALGIDLGKGGRDAGPAPRPNAPAGGGSALPVFSAPMTKDSSSGAPARDAGTAPRPRKRRAKG